MPEAADRALVSVATAYRYFGTAEELWEEAVFSIGDLVDEAAIHSAVEGAGHDVEARLDVVVRQIGWLLLEEELRRRQIAKTSLDRWFAQQRHGTTEQQPTNAAKHRMLTTCRWILRGARRR